LQKDNGGFQAFQSSVLATAGSKTLLGPVDLIPQTGAHEQSYGWYPSSGSKAGSWTQDWADSQLPYYNEQAPNFYHGAISNETPQRWDINNTLNTNKDSSVLHYLDVPENPFLKLSNANDYFGFRTELVGVRKDGTIRFLADDFPGAHLAYTWKSNTVTDGGGGYVFDIAKIAGSSLQGNYLGGGIYDVEPVGVPEPSSFVLVGLGLLGFVALRKKLRRD
jgi:hypothetical protein